MSLLPSSFKVYTSNISARDISYVNKMPATYPKYPFTNTEMKVKTFIDNISDIRNKIARIFENSWDSKFYWK